MRRIHNENQKYCSVQLNLQSPCELKYFVLVCNIFHFSINCILYFRGLFIIDDKGILRQITINDLPVGRSVDETLRLVQAFQFTDKHGEGMPHVLLVEFFVVKCVNIKLAAKVLVKKLELSYIKYRQYEGPI